MDTRVYESKRSVTLKNGTVKEYVSKSTYNPRPKRDTFKTDIAAIIKRIDDKEKLKRIKEFLLEIENDHQEIEKVDA